MAGTPNPTSDVLFSGDAADGGGVGGFLRVSTGSPVVAPIPSGPHVESGVATFNAGGSGEGYDYVTVTLARPFSSAGYTLVTTPAGGSDPSVLLPAVSPYFKTASGFRLYPDAQFQGTCTWRASDPGL